MIRHLRRRKSDGVWLCGGCGWQIDNQETPWRATCERCVRSPPWKPIMVGDLVERLLATIGITKPLVEKLTRTAGKPGGCGCAGRQKWLNEVGLAVQKKAHAALLAAKDFYLGK